MSKDNLLKFRCTEAEKEVIRKLAKSHDMKMSQFMLFLVKEYQTRIDEVEEKQE